MTSPQPPKFPDASFSTRQVVQILADAFGATQQTVGVVKSRLVMFQRHGLTRETPGRGRDITYSVSDVMDYALAMTFSAFGLPPRVIVKSMRMGIFEELYLPRLYGDGTPQNARCEIYLTAHLFYDYVDQLALATDISDRPVPSVMLPRTRCVADLTDLYERVRAAISGMFGSTYFGDSYPHKVGLIVK